MTLGTIVLRVALLAVGLTIAVGYAYKEHKSWLMTYLQNFCGAFFIFSGFVKAIDPLGLAYKMQQYFAQFETTLDGTWFSFLSGIFPVLSEASVSFSVIMIVFEIVLGVMLILGAKPKLTSWAFLLLVGFFTALTGFTYLTGYVPMEENFFTFSKWTAFNEDQMRVTDCGCFGDFLILKPKISFLKDIVLLFPAFFFVFKHKDMHQLFTPKIKMIILGFVIIALSLFCFRNFHFNLPVADFRPFKEGTDVRTSKNEQTEKVANAAFTWIMKNTKTGETKEFAQDDYPAEPWEFVDRKQAKIETNKIYDYSISGETVEEDILLVYKNGQDSLVEVSPADTADGGIQEDWTFVQTKTSEKTVDSDITVSLLGEEGYSIMIVSNKLPYASKSAFATKVGELHKGAEGKGVNFYAVVGGVGKEYIDEYKSGIQANYPFYTADDILLKTIVRSNPGIVLWRDGKIVKKWHHRQLPSFEDIEKNYMTEESNENNSENSGE